MGAARVAAAGWGVGIPDRAGMHKRCGEEKAGFPRKEYFRRKLGNGSGGAASAGGSPWQSGGEHRPDGPRGEAAQPGAHYHLIKYSSGQGTAAAFGVSRGEATRGWLLPPPTPRSPSRRGTDDQKRRRKDKL